MSEQLGLEGVADRDPGIPVSLVPEWRISVLATVLAGFEYPGRGGFENLRKGEQRACLDAARGALESLARASA